MHYAFISCVLLVYRVLDELKHKMYHSQMDRYLQLFHHRPVAAALYKKVDVTNGCVVKIISVHFLLVLLCVSVAYSFSVWTIRYNISKTNNISCC